MNQGKLIFAQIMEHLPLTTFRRCVARYGGERRLLENGRAVVGVDNVAPFDALIPLLARSRGIPIACSLKDPTINLR